MIEELVVCVIGSESIERIEFYSRDGATEAAVNDFKRLARSEWNETKFVLAAVRDTGTRGSRIEANSHAICLIGYTLLDSSVVVVDDEAPPIEVYSYTEDLGYNSILP